ncbi:hypothetical protein L596_001048 [Steinernema carpocapsae]|uniref:Uncharacterized protein n=1 Tax=Steinernema carpocapsae TaxID=34508 RepID=A0A4U8UL57_STECR|nr:hypothetical protein L596_001048 [Steinernema carpocapsae]
MLQLLEVGPPVPQLPLPAEVHLLKHHPALHGSKPARPPATTYHPSGYQGQGLQRQPNGTIQQQQEASFQKSTPLSVATPHYHLGCNINGCGTSRSRSNRQHLRRSSHRRGEQDQPRLHQRRPQRAMLRPSWRNHRSEPYTGTLARTTVLLDTGSNTTLISEKLVDQLGLPIVAVRDTNFTTVDAHTRVQCRYVLVRIILRTDKQGHGPTVEMVAMVKDKVLHGNINRPTLSDQDMKDIESKGYVLSEGRHGPKIKKLDLLIGTDYLNELENGPKWALPSGLTANPTYLGVVIAGKRTPSNTSKYHPADLSQSIQCATLADIVEQSKDEALNQGAQAALEEEWAMDHLPTGSKKEIQNAENEAVQAYFEKTLKCIEGRYEVAFPFKEGLRVHVPSNYAMAFKRMMSPTTRSRGTQSSGTRSTTYSKTSWLMESSKKSQRTNSTKRQMSITCRINPSSPHRRTPPRCGSSSSPHQGRALPQRSDPPRTSDTPEDHGHHAALPDRKHRLRQRHREGVPADRPHTSHRLTGT